MSATLKACRSCERIYRSVEDYLSATSRWRIGERGGLYFNCSCGSTLLIPKGSYDWYAPEKMLSSPANQLFNDLALGRSIPKVSGSIVSLQEAIEDESKSASDLVRLVKNEPNLAVDILKLANVARAEDNTEIRSLEHAIVYLGRRELRNLVLMATLRQFVFSSKVLTREIFWKEALMAGVIGESLAKKVRTEQTPDEVYLACCLANIGKVVAAAAIPDSVDAVFSLAKTKELTWVNAEQSLKAPSHEILGEIASIFWALPEYVMRSTVNHHGDYKFDLEQEFTPTIQIVAFANQAAHWMLGQPYRINYGILESTYRAMGIVDDMETFLEQIQPICEKVLSFLP